MAPSSLVAPDLYPPYNQCPLIQDGRLTTEALSRVSMVKLSTIKKDYAQVDKNSVIFLANTDLQLNGFLAFRGSLSRRKLTSAPFSSGVWTLLNGSIRAGRLYTHSLRAVACSKALQWQRQAPGSTRANSLEGRR